MFMHIAVGSNDIERARKFYDAIMAALDVEPGRLDAKGRLFYFSPGGNLVVTKPLDGAPATHSNGGTIGFRAASPEAVEAWHAAGIAAGGVSCEDPPGVRPANPALYLAYLRDPDGNKLCAVHRFPS